MLTPQELLRKRVIVENKWPGCNFTVGDILINDGDYYWQVGVLVWRGKVHKTHIEPYPYLMRPLSWWEGRDENDMPEYLKAPSGIIVTVNDRKEFVGRSYANDLEYLYADFLPATQSEYDPFIKQRVK